MLEKPSLISHKIPKDTKTNAFSHATREIYAAPASSKKIPQKCKQKNPDHTSLYFQRSLLRLYEGVFNLCFPIQVGNANI